MTQAPPSNGDPEPEPIEEQIQTSITQTLKTLGDIRTSPDDAGPEEEEKEKGGSGLFSRFRNSS